MLTNQNIQRIGVRTRERIFIQLYKSCFPGVARYVSRMGGSLEQAQDVFQDALLIYYERSVAGCEEPAKGEAPYVMGIARHLWLRRYKEESKALAWKPGADVAPEKELQPSAARILRYLETAGQKCMELLRAFYYDKARLEDIAAGFGFSGTRSATVQKFKCLEKVRETIKERSLSYEDFLE